MLRKGFWFTVLETAPTTVGKAWQQGTTAFHPHRERKNRKPPPRTPPPVRTSSSKLHLLKVHKPQSAPPAGDRSSISMGLWGTFLI